VKFYHPDADGVDLIAHSNGNLVARKFMLDHPGVVRRYLTAGAPWLGAAKPLLGLLTGDAEDLALNFIIPIGELEYASQFMPASINSCRAKESLIWVPSGRRGRLRPESRRHQLPELHLSPIRQRARDKPLPADARAAGFNGAVSPVRANHENFHKPDEGLPIATARRIRRMSKCIRIVSVQASPRSVAGARFVGRLHRNARTSRT